MVEQRWDTFEKFIKGNTKQDEQAAKLAYERRLDGLRNLRLTIDQQKVWDRIVRDELSKPELADALRKCATSANWHLRGAIRGNYVEASIPAFPAGEIQKATEEIDLRIKQLSADEQSETRKAMRKDFAELKKRIALQAIKSDVIGQIERLQKIDQLKATQKSVRSRPITEKSKALSDQLVTATLRNRFMREVEKLQIGTMPIELRKEPERSGKSYFKVALVGRPDEPLGDVLSEGEHRCIALAAFFAELVTAKEYSGIVFDDPMSSLDHLYRARVANRLVEEAEHRQVVVFTHDLSFLFEITRKAQAVDRPIKFQTIERRDEVPGFVREELPMKAKSTKSRILTLRGELKDLKGTFHDMSLAKREITAKGIIAELRATWEQGVADFVSPVLKQLDNEVRWS